MKSVEKRGGKETWHEKQKAAIMEALCEREEIVKWKKLALTAAASIYNFNRKDLYNFTLM